MRTTMRHICRAAVVGCVLAATAAAQVEPAPDAAEFAARVNAYVALRDRFEAPLPPLASGRHEWSLLIARRYLASAIRTARSHAGLGNLFTPPVAAMLRDRIDRALPPAQRLLLAGPDDGALATRATATRTLVLTGCARPTA